jgi:hypothetical protein
MAPVNGLERPEGELGGRADRLIGGGLAAALLAVYVLFRQESFYGDANLFLLWIEGGRWKHWHALYMPLAHGLHRSLGGLWGDDPETTLFLLSAVPAALSALLAFGSARLLGVGRAPAAGAAALLGIAPAVLFYGTALEVHALHLLGVSLAVRVAVRRGVRDGWAGVAPLVPLLFALAVWTHVTAVAAAPALAALALLGSGRWRWPRGGTAVVLACIGVVLVPVFTTADGALMTDLGAQGVVGTRSWSPHRFLHDGLVQVGVLAVAALGAFGARTALPDSARPATRWALAALIVPLVLFVPAFPYYEHGAYYFVSLPALALCAAVGLARLRPATLALALAIGLPLQGALAVREWRAWEVGYPERHWVEPMRAEMGDAGFLLTLTVDERKAVRRHSRIEAFSHEELAERAALIGGADFDPVQATVWTVGEFNRRGDAVAVLASCLEDEELAAVIAQLEEEVGRPLTPGDSPAYLFLGRTPGELAGDASR